MSLPRGVGCVRLSQRWSRPINRAEVGGAVAVWAACPVGWVAGAGAVHVTVAINRAEAGGVATVSAACLAGWVIGVHVLRV